MGDDAFDATTLVGFRFPDGEYTVGAAENERLCRLVASPPLPPGVAHPIFAHLATHVGKGMTFAELVELLHSSLDAGFLYGGGTLEYDGPILVDRTYAVRGGVVGVESRVGRRTGPFDLVTTELELVDAGGARAARSVETYVVPRRS